jgi:hypothetical protein
MSFSLSVTQVQCIGNQIRFCSAEGTISGGVRSARSAAQVVAARRFSAALAACAVGAFEG